MKFPSQHRLFAHVVTGLIICGVPYGASANERKFSYTYESGTLPKGTREIEGWATWRTGRTNFYSRFDHRVEFEIGLTDRLLSAFYLNWHRETTADPVTPGAKIDTSEFEGMSAELKYKLLDPTANPVGLALYQEYTVHSDEFEWESKLILDKRLGDNLLAYNFVAEPGWQFGPGGTVYALNIENDLGLTHFFTSSFSAGLEVQNTNEKNDHSRGLQNSTLFAGPVFSYAREGWWITGTILRQLPAIKRSVDHPEDSLVLDSREKFNVRLIVSVRI